MFRLRVCARVRIYIFRLDIAFKTWQHYRSFSFYRNLFIYLIFIFVFTINLPISSKCHVEQLSSLRIIDISLKKKEKREKKRKNLSKRVSRSLGESSERTTRHPIPLLLFILNNYLADETWLSKRKKKKTNEISDNRKKSRIQNLYPDFRISVHIYIYIYIHSRKEDIANKARVEK